jgi:hypothetical protein
MVTGTVGGAARLLNVSSPGSSRVMKNAEASVGVQTVWPKRWPLHANAPGQCHLQPDQQCLRQSRRSAICHFANQAWRQHRTQIWIGAKHRECHGALIGVDPNDPYGRIMAGLFADHALHYDVTIQARFGSIVCALVSHGLGIASSTSSRWPLTSGRAYGRSISSSRPCSRSILFTGRTGRYRAARRDFVGALRSRMEAVVAARGAGINNIMLSLPHVLVIDLVRADLQGRVMGPA